MSVNYNADAGGFIGVACMLLGTLNGALIALPPAAQIGSLGGALCVFGGALAGFVIGRRARNKRLFFYISAVTAVILASIISRNMIAPH